QYRTVPAVASIVAIAAAAPRVGRRASSIEASASFGELHFVARKVATASRAPRLAKWPCPNPSQTSTVNESPSLRASQLSPLADSRCVGTENPANARPGGTAADEVFRISATITVPSGVE